MAKTGDLIDSDYMLNILKQKFQINPRWLRYGEGEMFLNTESAQVIQTKVENNKQELLNAKFHNLDSDEIVQFYIEKEKLGRILISHSFPNPIYLMPYTTPEFERQFLFKKDFVQKEFYPIESLLLFGFSIIGSIHLDRKNRDKILETMIEVFSLESTFREIVFLDTSLNPKKLPANFNFSNLQIVGDFTGFKTILIQTPFKGILELEGEIVTEIKDFYSEQINLPCIRGRDSVQILRILKEMLSESEVNLDNFKERIQHFLDSILVNLGEDILAMVQRNLKVL